MQMPILSQGAKFEHYVPYYPDASARLKAGVEFLQKEGYQNIAIVSHSISSRITNWYLWHTQNPPIKSWVSIGIVAGVYDWIDDIPCPVLDLYAENDFNIILWQSARRGEQIKKMKPGSEQIMAPNTEHFFEGRDKELVNYVVTFLDKTLPLSKDSAAAKPQ